MIQLAAVIIAFLLIPVLGKLKIKLSYTLLLSALILGLISGIGPKAIFGSVVSVFTHTFVPSIHRTAHEYYYLRVVQRI